MIEVSSKDECLRLLVEDIISKPLSYWMNYKVDYNPFDILQEMSDAIIDSSDNKNSVDNN